MAQRVTVALVDDLDGKQADETVTFGLDGVTYEIDLASKNADKLRKALASYVDAGRRVSGRKTRGPQAVVGPKPAEVRVWARANGYEVPDRGRVSAEIQEAYDAAH